MLNIKDFCTPTICHGSLFAVHVFSFRIFFIIIWAIQHFLICSSKRNFTNFVNVFIFLLDEILHSYTDMGVWHRVDLSGIAHSYFSPGKMYGSRGIKKCR